MWACVNAVPLRTSLSIVGVEISWLPNAAMVSNRWSSVRKNTMFGRLRMFLPAAT
jgi:hypothetical protein